MRRLGLLLCLGLVGVVGTVAAFQSRKPALTVKAEPLTFSVEGMTLKVEIWRKSDTNIQRGSDYLQIEDAEKILVTVINGPKPLDKFKRFFYASNGGEGHRLIFHRKVQNDRLNEKTGEVVSDTYRENLEYNLKERTGSDVNERFTGRILPLRFERFQNAEVVMH